MTEKSLEEEVAELERRLQERWRTVDPWSPGHPRDTILRLIADWRKRGEQIEELERCLESAIKWWPDDDRENELLDVYRASLSKGKSK